MSAFAPILLAMPGAIGGPYGNLLIAIIVLLIVVLVGRVVLALAWRILLLAGVVIAALYVLSLVAG